MSNFIDTERVIDEVRCRRCLWDPADELYKNKDAKNKAWEEIGKELYGENFNTYLDKQIRQRWKSARDNYYRTKGNMRNTPSGSAAKHKKYLFFEQMTFLDRTLENEITDSLSDNQSVVSQDSTAKDMHGPATQQENNNDTPRWNQKRRNKGQKGQSNFENELITLLNKNSSNLSSDDLSFFESLAPTLNNLSAYQKLQFRSKVLGLVIEISSSTTSTSSILTSPENNVISSVNENCTYNYTTRTSPFHNYNSITSTPRQDYESALEFPNIISPTGNNNSTHTSANTATYSSIVESMNLMHENDNEEH